MAVAVAVTTQCPYCIEIHAKKARQAGATEQELAETTLIAAALRAGGAVTHGTHTLEWAVPRKAGTNELRVDATDLAGNPADVEGDLEVLKPTRKRRG